MDLSANPGTPRDSALYLANGIFGATGLIIAVSRLFSDISERRLITSISGHACTRHRSHPRLQTIHGLYLATQGSQRKAQEWDQDVHRLGFGQDTVGGWWSWAYHGGTQVTHNRDSCYRAQRFAW